MLIQNIFPLVSRKSAFGYNNSMKVKCIILGIIVILVYCAVSYYGGLRIFQSFAEMLAPGWTTICLLVYVLLTAAYPLGRLGAVIAPSSLGDALIRYGAAWLAWFFI